MSETPQTKLLTMPNDDEFFHTLVDAANDGAHENIKKVIKQITGYVEKAKSEIKRLVNFDPEKGLSLNLTVPVGDATLAAFIDAQNLLVKGLAKALMFSVGASTFGGFLKKMKERPDDSKEVTINTTTRVLTMFFQKLGEKYVINETPEHIREVVVGLFDQI
ncbi:MAG: hypothetical protein LBG59_01165 [Candidatus Peribacteria bacterium]|jgi:hypothetical protein|nr:hypothetical protein [Candidatus Peribacteria bacterium]